MQMTLTGSRPFNGKFGHGMSGISWIVTTGLAMMARPDPGPAGGAYPVFFFRAL